MASKTGNAAADSGGFSLATMLQESFTCGMVTVDAQDRIIALTSSAETLLGLPSRDRSLSSLPVSVQALVRESRASRGPILDRHIVVVPNESSETEIAATALSASGPGSPVTTVVLLRDLTSADKLDQHMRRLNRLASIGTLSASMAHEIKNALVPLQTFVGLLLENAPGAELAGTVQRELDRVDKIVSRMLKFSGPSKPSFSGVRVHELLDQSLRLVQHRVESKCISFNRRFNATPDALNGDDYQLEQAFVNLLLNAVEAVGTEGTVTIETNLVSADQTMGNRGNGDSPKALSVKIADTGVGIAPDQLASIFDPFFTTKPHGTGLGLAVTRRIIEEHDGVIQVTSEPGKGTAFTVFLPTTCDSTNSGVARGCC